MREDSLGSLADSDAGLGYGRKFSIQSAAFLILLITLLGIIFLSIGIGAVEISPLQSLAILFHQIGIELPVSFSGQQESVLWGIRLPRVVLGLTVGASLAVAGAVLQSLFRNPLADPALIGVSVGRLYRYQTIVFGETIAVSFWQSANLISFLWRLLSADF